MAADEEDVELDVHVIELGEGGAVIPLCNDPWRFDAGSLNGRGTISGRQVACISAPTDVAMHHGYELPEAHERDLELLQQLT